MSSVLVCGGGLAAQVATCLFGARHRVAALSLHAGEVARWSEVVKANGFMECAFRGSHKAVRSTPDVITSDPSAVRHCDVVLVTVPSSFHGLYFTALAPHVKDGTVFAVMPAKYSCESLFSKAMGEKAGKLGLVAFDSLPWACCVNEWGRTSTVLGVKEAMRAAVRPPAGQTRMEVMLKMQGLLGVHPMMVGCPDVIGSDGGFGNPREMLWDAASKTKVHTLFGATTHGSPYTVSVEAYQGPQISWVRHGTHRM